MLLFLIGMMGSGKSTIGIELAKKLKYDYVDTDQLIEKQYSCKIKDLIHQKGIDYFRKIETDTLKHLSVDINTIVSTGGGMILKNENIIYMKSHGKVIYLKNSVESLAKRLKHTNLENRPLLNEDLVAPLTKLYDDRKELYELASDITINCDRLTIDETIIEILNQLVN